MNADSHPPPADIPGTDHRVPMVVLVHGAWHGAWCWAALQAELDRRSIATLAIDLPGHGTSTAALGGVHDDAEALTNVIDQLATADVGPVVLVGHSYGGAVITQAAAGRDDVAHLVYLAAFALDAGESVLTCLGSLERHDVALAAATTPTADGTATTLDRAVAAGALYNECPPEVIPAALARLGPQSMTSFTDEIDGDPRSDIASTYVVCRRDRSVHPAHQETLAARCSRRLEIDTDHSPFLSSVDATADAIEQIVGASA